MYVTVFCDYVHGYLTCSVFYFLLENPMQIFCEHYQFLVENMQPKSLLESLREKTQQVLLSDSELDSTPIDFMKNVYVVEKVRHMETPHLFMFLDVLQDVSGQQHISNTILNGTNIRNCISKLIFCHD